MRFDQYLTESFNAAVFAPWREQAEDARPLTITPAHLPRPNQSDTPRQRR
ncbi:MAG: hypothetical protein IOD08_16835 [Bradyrhizobium sp.]|nr:hypothetical protein [Bradyrhizobium sp.]MCA3578939.1 hypothetical protein [Bradyrhizobium sp.]